MWRESQASQQQKALDNIAFKAKLARVREDRERKAQLKDEERYGKSVRQV